MTKQSSAHPTAQKKYPLGIFLILGAVIGLLLVLLYTNGAWEVWHKVNPPPVPAVKFEGVSVYFYQANPYVRAQDGETYYCEARGSVVDGQLQTQCLWKVETMDPYAYHGGCSPGGIRFTSWKVPFGRAVDCTEAVMVGEFMGAAEVTFVIDERGELWFWAQENRGNLIFFGPAALLMGLLTGMVTAAGWSPLRAFLRGADHREWSALSQWEAKTLRLIGRVGSLISLAFFAVLLTINQNSLPPRTLQDIVMLGAVLVGALGLIAAWRWETLGAVVALSAAAAALLISLPAGASQGGGMLLLTVLLPYLPGFFFLAAGLLERRQAG